MGCVKLLSHDFILYIELSYQLPFLINDIEYDSRP